MTWLDFFIWNFSNDFKANIGRPTLLNNTWTDCSVHLLSIFKSLTASIKLLCFHREPDSTYFELPPGSQPGEQPVPSASTPGCSCSAAESSMDVYHLRNMNDNVMVGTWATFIFVYLWSVFVCLFYMQLILVTNVFMHCVRSEHFLLIERLAVCNHILVLQSQPILNSATNPKTQNFFLLLFLFVCFLFCFSRHNFCRFRNQNCPQLTAFLLNCMQAFSRMCCTR